MLGPIAYQRNPVGLSKTMTFGSSRVHAAKRNMTPI